MWTDLLQLGLVFLLGGIVGFEREHKNSKGAGLKTHTLVSTGSALIMLTSLHIQRVYGNQPDLDSTRIAAGVIPGIGFLGGGVIIKSQEGARGLTTAATIWIVAAIGCGYYFEAVVATALSQVALRVLRLLEESLPRFSPIIIPS